MSIYQKAIAFAEQNSYFETLQQLYNDLPKCSGCISCKACCSESVNVSYIEFLYILKKYYPEYEAFDDLPSFVQEKLLKFSIFEWSIPLKCPFLDDSGMCDIYEARPLACRVYGTMIQREYEENYDAILRQNKQLAATLLLREGARPPTALIMRQIPFCNIVTAEHYSQKTHLDAWHDRLMYLDSQLYFKEYLPDAHLSGHLVGHFILSAKAILASNIKANDLLSSLKAESMRRLYQKNFKKV